jgi:DNA repair exonuclease SbcCD ATPase subunit
MNYYCECCNYSTKRNSSYEKHLETKKHKKLAEVSPKLAQNDTFFCKYCNIEFKHKSSLSKHIKYSCKENNDEDLKELVRLLNEQNKEINNQNKEIMNDLKNTNEQNKEIMNELKSKNEQIKKLQKQIDKLSNKLKIKNIHNNTQNNTINYNIQLLNYNDTDYSHLTTKDYIKCINDCNHSVKTLIEKVHFNDKKPENKNIYISNIKNGYVMLYKDNKWQLVDRKSQIDDLYDYNEVVLDTWYRANKETHPDIIASFTKYLKNIEEGNDLINNVKQQILLMLYNNRLLDL